MSNSHSQAGVNSSGAIRPSVWVPAGQKSSQSLLARVWMAATGLAVLGFLTANPLLTAACLLTLPLIATLIMKGGGPPVLLFACAIQWLQVVVSVFYSDLSGSRVAEEFGVPKIETAIWLSLLGLVALAFGMRMALGGQMKFPAQEIKEEVVSLDLRRLSLAWLAAFALAFIVGLVAFEIPGLAQIIFSLRILKWVFFYILAYHVLVTKQGYGLLAIAVLLELAAGFTGYFADFKTVFCMFLLAIISVRSISLSRHRLLLSASVIVIVIALLSLIWTAVKKDYRDYLNQGTGMQIVAVPLEDRLKKLGELVLTLDRESLLESVETLALRVEYTTYFGLTISEVPENVPYEQGKLWLGAVTHVFMPRLFFPDKRVLDDSEIVRKYTGISVAGAAEGTSIGIGYMGESYIDFGPYLMVLPIFLLGLFFGYVYRYFVLTNRWRILGFAIATAILLPSAQAFEASNVKIFAGTVLNCLIMFTLNFLFGVRAMAWLRRSSPAPQ